MPWCRISGSDVQEVLEEVAGTQRQDVHAGQTLQALLLAAEPDDRTGARRHFGAEAADGEQMADAAVPRRRDDRLAVAILLGQEVRGGRVGRLHRERRVRAR